MRMVTTAQQASAHRSSSAATVTQVAAAAFFVLLFCAFFVPANHDEGQYVAAAAMIARGLIPYRDFQYLQTPLQPLLYAPLTLLVPGWTYLATRIANAVAVALGLALIGKTAGKLAGDRRAGWIAILLALTCDSVLFAGSVARNDALPFLFLAASLERLFAAQTPPTMRRLFIAGLFAGMAASTKISYAFPAFAIGFQALLPSRAMPRDRAAALIGGMALGALPSAVFLVLHPQQFLFGVYTYSIDGVKAWQALSGHAERLTVSNRALRLLSYLVQGALLPLLVAAAWVRLHCRAEPNHKSRLAVDLGPILLASLVAAALPMPPYRQYLVPIVPPLLLWLAAYGFDRLPGWRDRLPFKAGAALAILICCGGLVRTVNDIGWGSPTSRPMAVEAAAHRLGRALAPFRLRAVAGLEPVRIVDSGLPLDSRFATGPFVFRAGNLAACRDQRLCPVTFATLQTLDNASPGAIVTGFEKRASPAFLGGLDSVLDFWAAAHGFAPHSLADGSQLWIAPEVVAPPRRALPPPLQLRGGALR